jgi:dimethylargininase
VILPCARTNAAGAQQMMQILHAQGYTASTIALHDFLHLKTGVSYLDDGVVLVSGELINHPQLTQFQNMVIAPEEAYAANCIMINGRVLMPAGNPKTERAINALGFAVIALDVSEFRKIDGGLSCLSLRF